MSDRRATVLRAAGALALAAIVGGVVGGLLVARLGSGDDRACRSAALADAVLPSVVTIFTSAQGGSGNGTGEIISDGGYILTNFHVVESVASGGSLYVEYSDGARTPATIVGSEPSTDLAVVQARDRAAARPTIDIGSSEKLLVGQPVVALGAPLGLQSTVTAGVVSALGRYLSLPLLTGTAHLVDAIQTDASINPGNSGGPLVDCAGRLVGVNTAISTVPNAQGVGGGGSVGVGFAIPVDLAKPIADQLIAHGRVSTPDLGLGALAITGDRGSVPAGLLVRTVYPQGAAERAGVQVGDVIVRIEGQPAQSLEQLGVQSIRRGQGQSVAITLSRQGREVNTEIAVP